MNTSYEIRAHDDGGAQDFDSLFGASTQPNYASIEEAQARADVLNNIDPARGYYIHETETV